ncbi:MAG: hypothetical protein HETSPECPRED_010533 [Heterodermia speciosa]|uniref:Dienelactone hydrolase domain-containing protein n=1 Tax=Heterodermia speciosa TaxID=116794 RepID=A0A8H3J058_9LECA|nr:MAG: hypothetical protein HETSPECPRED_010533 [Heterodermia speciosa]
MAQHGHSEACCSVPPAVAKDYKEKGKFVEIGGLKTYATGPSSATSAILIIYDIFGYSPQAIQGADILAHADDEHHQYQVFIPDFFEGKPAEYDWYPPDTKEKGEKLGAFFQGPAAPPKNAEKVPQLVEAIKKYSPKIEKSGVLGMCWGGKIVSLTSQSGTVFSAAAEVHPAMVDPNDAKGISIPICMLPSGDEDQEAVKGFQEALNVPNYIETFPDQVHGWMAARGDLENEKVKKEYERGYSVLLDFFHKHL